MEPGQPGRDGQAGVVRRRQPPVRPVLAAAAGHGGDVGRRGPRPGVLAGSSRGGLAAGPPPAGPGRGEVAAVVPVDGGGAGEVEDLGEGFAVDEVGRDGDDGGADQRRHGQVKGITVHCLAFFLREGVECFLFNAGFEVGERGYL